jgi:predicted DNA-binding protein
MKDKKQFCNIRITQDMNIHLKQLAISLGITRSELIRRLIAAFIKAAETEIKEE